MTDPVEDLILLLKGLRVDVNNPRKSHKAGDMIVLLNKINTKIDNYDRANRRKRRINRRI